jgi:prevent-host-death family protein
MTIVTVHEAKTNLSKLLKLVEAGEEVVIARGSVHVARLLPMGEPKRRLGYGSFADLKGKISNDSFFEPLSEEEQRLWEGQE